jgi:hypothetical protein
MIGPVKWCGEVKRDCEAKAWTLDVLSESCGLVRNKMRVEWERISRGEKLEISHMKSPYLTMNEKSHDFSYLEQKMKFEHI